MAKVSRKTAAPAAKPREFRIVNATRGNETLANCEFDHSGGAAQFREWGACAPDGPTPKTAARRVPLAAGVSVRDAFGDACGDASVACVTKSQIRAYLDRYGGDPEPLFFMLRSAGRFFAVACDASARVPRVKVEPLESATASVAAVLVFAVPRKSRA